MGYHKTEISKGTLGEFSKIKEEFLEFTDAVEQENPILQLVELSDMLGAIEFYIKKYNITLQDLINMSELTKSTFTDGRRSTSEFYPYNVENR